MEWGAEEAKRRRALDAQSCLDEVCALIAQEKAQPSGELDLSYFKQLHTLPPSLAELRHLQTLDISSNRISDLAPLAGLKGLQSLVCSWNQVSDLAPLAGLTGLQSLDCSSTQVSDLAPLAGLKGLQSLACSGTQVSDLAPLAGLKGLQSLRCSETQVSDLAPLAGLTGLQSLVCFLTQVSDLTPLEGLKGLQSLFCSDTQVSDLSPLVGLKGLQSLNCSGTRVSDLAPLAGLKGLQSLVCYRTRVSDLAPLAGLKDLQSLDCSSTEVSDLAPLAGLKGLQSLDCSFTSIKALPPVFPAPQMEKLIAYRCKLPGIPSEILSHEPGENCLPRLRAYLQDLQAGAQSLASAKLMILGNGRVGKTQLLNRLRERDFEDHADSTHGVQIQRLARGDKEWHAWDFGGQDIYHSTHALFLRNRAAFIIVWSPDCETGEHSDQYGMCHANQPLEYWLRYVLSHAGADCPLLIVQTRCETAQQQVANLPVPENLLAQFRQLEILHYSSKTKRKHQSLEEALREAHTYLLAQHPAQIPLGWGRVTRQLCAWREQDYARTTQEKQHRLLTQAMFAQLCAQGNGDVSSAPALLDYLHHTGLVFYKKNLFDENIILDQAWALDAIYTVFQRDTCYRYLKQAGGRFTPSLLGMLAWPNFSASEQKLLLSMMRSCSIVFELRRADSKKQIEAEYLAPDFLPPQEAIQIQLDSQWDKDLPYEQATLEYDLMQPGLMRTLIARIGRQAGEAALYWQHGVCVYEAGSQAKAWIAQESTGVFSGRLILKTQRGQAGLLMQKLVNMLTEEGWGWRYQAKFKQTMQGGKMSEAVDKPVFTAEPVDQTLTRYAVSYKWEDKSNAIVDQLCEHAHSKGITILRDKDAVRFGDSLSQFMSRLAQQDRVFVLLSDAYLKSPNCMYELWKIWCNTRQDDEDFTQRVRVYVQPDANIFSLKGRAAYAIYWKEAFNEMEDLLKQHGASILGEKDLKHYSLMQKYALNVSDILSCVVDRLLPRSWDDFVQYGFADPPAGG